MCLKLGTLASLEKRAFASHCDGSFSSSPTSLMTVVSFSMAEHLSKMFTSSV